MPAFMDMSILNIFSRESKQPLTNGVNFYCIFIQSLFNHCYSCNLYLCHLPKQYNDKGYKAM